MGGQVKMRQNFGKKYNILLQIQFPLLHWLMNDFPQKQKKLIFCAPECTEKEIDLLNFYLPTHCARSL